MGFGYVVLTEREIEFLRTSPQALRLVAQWHFQQGAVASRGGRASAQDAHEARGQLLWLEATRLESRS